MGKQNSLFDFLLEKLPRSPEEVELRNVIDYVWTDGEQVLCGCKEHADFLVDLLKNVDGEVFVAKWYDPKKDRENNDMDEFTGWWYVYLN